MAVYALSAHSRMQRLAEQALVSRAAVVVVPDTAARQKFIDAWPGGQPMPEIRVGAQALADTAADPQCDAVMAAIVGAAGLPSALAAARAGKRVLLANKEALVAAGTLFMQAIRDNGAELLPIDSEHNAIFQCLPHQGRADAPHSPAKGVRRLLLTASGGPFRGRDLEDLHDVTPEQACAHPNWSMGAKISVDSATMANKGLEMIEAAYLFDQPADKIDVVVHPESIIHSLVEMVDGSTLAQLGPPDMKTPIACALAWPERVAWDAPRLDLAQLGKLTFEAPDEARFPALSLARQALRAGGEAPAVFNAANEVAALAFLGRRLAFLNIAAVVAETLERATSAGAAGEAGQGCEAALAIDAKARRIAEAVVQSLAEAA